MATESIIEINVGGRLFQTTVFTLTKYPGSMLSAMFVHTDTGMLPMPKTKDGQYFLDANPKYFEIILDWLRLGEITTNDPDIMKGTLSLANYFGLEDLMEKLKSLQNESKLINRKSYPEIIHICIGNNALKQALEVGPNESYSRLSYCDGHIGPSVLSKNKITRVPQSLISRYFDGENVYVPIRYDVKSGFFVFDEHERDKMEVVGYALYFLESDSNIIVHDFVNEIKGLLRKLGIKEESHYKHYKEFEDGEDSEGESYFLWNDEFVMKYAD